MHSTCHQCGVFIFFSLINRHSQRIGWLQFLLQRMKWLKRAYVSIENDMPFFLHHTSTNLNVMRFLCWYIACKSLRVSVSFWHVPWRFVIFTDKPEQYHNISIHMALLGKPIKILFGCACSYCTQTTPATKTKSISAKTSVLTISAIFFSKIIIFGLIMSFSFCSAEGFVHPSAGWIRNVALFLAPFTSIISNLYSAMNCYAHQFVQPFH